MFPRALEESGSGEIAVALAADGSEVALRRESWRFVIRVNGRILMSSGCTGSEVELARIGCGHLVKSRSPEVLVAGLGFGYTLRAALDLLPSGARVTVAEIIPAVVEWNRTVLGDVCGHPVEDPRVRVWMGDVIDLLRDSPGLFDAILLDVDNGPCALSFDGNRRLYESEGLAALRGCLRRKGVLSVWSADPAEGFARALTRSGFLVEIRTVPVNPVHSRLVYTLYRAWAGAT